MVVVVVVAEEEEEKDADCMRPELLVLGAYEEDGGEEKRKRRIGFTGRRDSSTNRMGEVKSVTPIPRKKKKSDGGSRNDTGNRQGKKGPAKVWQWNQLAGRICTTVVYRLAKVQVAGLANLWFRLVLPLPPHGSHSAPETG